MKLSRLNVIIEDKMSRPAGARGLKLRHPQMPLLCRSSRPAGARGLKPAAYSRSDDMCRVAPRGGARIETTRWKSRPMAQSSSRPAGARGLKLDVDRYGQERL